MIPAVVLAAGRGTRLGRKTELVAKPMLEVGGEAVLSRNLRSLAEAGVRDVAINLFHAPESITSVIGDGRSFGLTVLYSHEQALLGTAGGAKQAAALLPASEDVLVVYGDNLLRLDLARMIEAHVREGASVTIAGHHRRDVRGSGVIECDPAGWIQRFIEKPGAGETRSHLVNAGVYVLRRALLEESPEGFADFGHDLLPAWLARGERLLAWRLKDGETVVPVDSPGLFRAAQRRIAAHVEATHGRETAT